MVMIFIVLTLKYHLHLVNEVNRLLAQFLDLLLVEEGPGRVAGLLAFAFQSGIELDLLMSNEEIVVEVDVLLRELRVVLYQGA
jgi:hypothetical protein